jgi:PST family polysaccharide transporter
MTSLESIATLGFQNGIKYVLKSKKISVALKNYCLHGFLSSFVAVVLSVVLFVFATFWNQKIFGTNYQYQSVFKVLALALPCTSSPSFNCRSEWFG